MITVDQVAAIAGAASHDEGEGERHGEGTHDALLTPSSHRYATDGVRSQVVFGRVNVGPGLSSHLAEDYWAHLGAISRSNVRRRRCQGPEVGASRDHFKKSKSTAILLV